MALNHDNFRPMVRQLRSQDKNAKEIHENLLKIFQKNVPSYTTIARWVRDIDHFGGLGARGHGPGRPVDVSTPERIDQIRSLLHSDRKLSLRQISEKVQLPHSTVRKIIIEKIGMKKVFARWVPKVLSTVEKRNRLDFANQFMASFGANWARYRNRIITVDETWVSYKPDAGLHATAEWRYPDEPRPERSSTKLTSLKVMATIFWDIHGILLIDYLPKGSKFTSEYYCSLLDKLEVELRSNRRSYSRVGYWLLQDNAKVHTAKLSMEKIKEIGLKPMPHPPYSPDISPCDYYLFRNMKSELRLRTYKDKGQIEAAIEEFFDSKEVAWFEKGIDELPERVNNVISLKGGYLND